ncbi:hypothetical protein PCASD_14685 [Puccinia coronata f. sp. avenae]|uniref:Uncharacterized protein n=1 Tax=Puccinia coronata f. sp. avenae TaxID=200324 RepID=A0A2N5TED2_9BASI|nr:hypothetical protein PCASD_14685 [Puccinia coronata f. sp. avenae]
MSLPSNPMGFHQASQSFSGPSPSSRQSTPSYPNNAYHNNARFPQSTLGSHHDPSANVLNHQRTPHDHSSLPHHLANQLALHQRANQDSSTYSHQSLHSHSNTNTPRLAANFFLPDSQSLGTISLSDQSGSHYYVPSNLHSSASLNHSSTNHSHIVPSPLSHSAHNAGTPCPSSTISTFPSNAWPPRPATRRRAVPATPQTAPTPQHAAPATQQAAPATQHAAPASSTPAAPLADLTKRKSRKRKCLQPADQPPIAPRSREELMKESEAQLAITACLNSKKAMSDADRAHFREFYCKQRQLLIIEAIERGVSVPMVDEYLGRRMPLKKPTRWNHFMKTPGARAEFRGSRKGIKHRPAMGGVSSLWHSLTHTEQESYKEGRALSTGATDSRSAATQHNSSEGNVSGPAGGDEGNGLAGEREGDGPADGFEDVDSDGSGDVDRDDRHLVSLKRAKNHAVHVAKTANCEMVLFVVSRHIAAHSFQLVRATHGASTFVSTAARLDGTRNYGTRLQAYLTGYEVAEIAQCAKSKKGVAKLRPVSAIARMSTLVAKKTNGAQSRWPWTNTDFKLAKIKYRLELLPSAKTQPNWLKKPSQGLHPSFQTIIHNDLDNNLIDVVYDPSIPDGITEEQFLGMSPSPLLHDSSRSPSSSPDHPDLPHSEN